MQAGERAGRQAGQRASERGFSFAAVLVLLALCMLSLSIAGPLWSQQVRREREQELLRIGNLYAQALAEYHDASPGSAKQYPQRLEQLLSDTRYVGLRRYLRKLYPDPIDPAQPWGLVLDAQQRIVGVYSRSEQAPIAQGPQALGATELDPAQHYADWKFLAKVKKTS